MRSVFPPVLLTRSAWRPARPDPGMLLITVYLAVSIIACLIVAYR